MMASSKCCQIVRNIEKKYSSLLLSANEGPRTLEIVWPHLLTTPSTALCMHSVLIAHAQAQYR